MESLFSIILGLCSLGNNDQSCVNNYIKCAEDNGINWARRFDDRFFTHPVREFHKECSSKFKKDSPNNDGGFGTKEF